MDRRRKLNFSKYNKNTHEWEEENLDEEMEEIFHPARDHFSLADLVERTSEAKPNIDENDFDLHRRESLQYHQPLHKLYRKHKKTPDRNDKEETEKSPQQMTTVAEESAIDSSKQPKVKVTISKDKADPNSVQGSDPGKVQFYVGSSSSLENAASSVKKPLKSVLRAMTNRKENSTSDLSPSFNATSRLKKSSEDAISESLEKPLEESESTLSVGVDKEKAKVTFLLGEESQNDLQNDLSRTFKDVVDVVPESTSPSHPKHARRRSTKRKHHGFNIDAKKYNTVLEPEEAETLQFADIDDMASHRFEDPKGMHRSKIKNKFWPAFLKKDEPLFSFHKKKYDLEPHELFIELHELQTGECSTDIEWRETARWIKYEEDVELGPDRWGKPHVPPLCFNSLIKLRQCMEAGAVLLDLEENDIVGISNKIVDAMIQTDQFPASMQERVSRILMKRHRHVNEKTPALRRNSSGYGNLSLLTHDKNRSPLSKASQSKSVSEATPVLNNGESSAPPETAILIDNNETKVVDFTPNSKRKSFSLESAKVQEPWILRRIPETAEGVAVLVGQLEEFERPASTFVRLAEGKEIPHFLEIPIKVRFVYVILGPKDSPINFHEIGRAFGSLMSNEEFRINAYRSNNMKDILSAINKFLDSSTVVPPGKWDRISLLPLDEIRRKSLLPIKALKGIKEVRKPSYDPLKYRRKCFGGLIEDIKHRYPYFISDIFDGLNFQCVASMIFIYFAAISGAIAFGGLLADKTDMQIGVSETLIGTAICGVLFSLLAGQPLIIIGTTGPLLLFDEMLYQLRGYYSVPFLVMRVWIGICTTVIAIVLVAAEASVLVKYFSRFVQEIFATIISLLFIYESLFKLYKTFVENPLLPDYCGNEMFGENNTVSETTPAVQPQPNTALLSTILTIGTFYIALFLRHFRNSKFLGRSARRALGDFGVPIAIVVMVLIDYLIPDTYTQKLSVPEGLSPSTDRSWIISPLPMQWLEFVLAFAGGLLLFILLFMETQICELIISKKKLKKGSGFHIDMVIIGIMGMISAFIGGPWQCAATVRSISHVSSLIVWSKTHAPGEMPHIIDVKEQRLTNLSVSVLVGLSVFMAPILRQVPLAVLFGVFLYMGISALSGIHLYERFILIFMPVKHHPDFPFVRKVRTKKMHLYTLIQILCIAVLWIIKTYFSPGFPFGLLSMVFVHSQIKRLFTKEEIEALDEEGTEEEGIDEDDPDFYEQIVA